MLARVPDLSKIGPCRFAYSCVEAPKVPSAALFKMLLQQMKKSSHSALEGGWAPQLQPRVPGLPFRREQAQQFSLKACRKLKGAFYCEENSIVPTQPARRVQP